MSDMYQAFADEIAALGGLTSAALRRALATVKRDRFLPPGPWVIENLEGQYYRSEDADPRRVLHAVGVSLDPERMLNNANPVRVCGQIALADPKPGERVFHVGAGVGYYSAILAEMVGPTGAVLAAEIDPVLRERARANLAGWPQVTIVEDAIHQKIGPMDMIYSNAGLATLPETWLDALVPGGRMILPLTGPQDHGVMLILRKISEQGPMAAAAQSFTRHFPCFGARDSADLAALGAAFSRPISEIASLRRDKHVAGPDCWLHREHFCLSRCQAK